ncbi:MAG: sugar ABC transporter permease [Erysipelotrichaceae bacterium]|nr:sugar ABC transporter permease [Erysipelotrichaceae bacterium]
MKRKLTRKQKTEAKWGLIMVTPTLIGLLVLNFYPIVQTIYLSLCKTGDFGIGNVFIGFGNYIDAFKDPEVFQAMINTFKYAIVTVPIGISISLVLAVLLNRKMKGRTFYRTIYFLPMICAPAAVAMVWRWMYNMDFGLINHALGTNTGWITDPSVAWICVAVVGIWSGLGYNMVLLLGGLQDIPKDYYEAATIDGASGFHTFFNITIPMLSPMLFFIIQTGIIGALQLFDLPFMIMDTTSRAFSSVKPITYLFYEQSFIYSNRGYGAAIVVVMLVIIGIITFAIQRLEKKWVFYN